MSNYSVPVKDQEVDPSRSGLSFRTDVFAEGDDKIKAVKDAGANAIESIRLDKLVEELTDSGIAANLSRVSKQLQGG